MSFHLRTIINSDEGSNRHFFKIFFLFSHGILRWYCPGRFLMFSDQRDFFGNSYEDYFRISSKNYLKSLRVSEFPTILCLFVWFVQEWLLKFLLLSAFLPEFSQELLHYYFPKISSKIPPEFHFKIPPEILKRKSSGNFARKNSQILQEFLLKENVQYMFPFNSSKYSFWEFL